MHSKNPVFARRQEFSGRPQQPQYAQFGQPGQFTPQGAYSPQQLDEMYQRPAATPAQTGRMTYDDVVVRTASLFAVLLVTAAATWFLAPPALLFPLWIGAMLVGLGIGVVVALSRTVRPPLMVLYAAFEGVFIGAVSLFFESVYPGIVVQAVLGTLAAFTAMLVAYKVKAIRVTPKFTRILIIATMGYAAFALVNFLAVMLFGTTSVYSMGLLGVGISLLGVTLASLNLVLDFDYVDRGVQQGLPQQYSWVAAFGLVVTLVWLYIEILRLIAILRGSD